MVVNLSGGDEVGDRDDCDSGSKLSKSNTEQILPCLHLLRKSYTEAKEKDLMLGIWVSTWVEFLANYHHLKWAYRTLISQAQSRKPQRRKKG